MKKEVDNTKIELSGCVLKIKGITLTLTLTELHALKTEIDKVIPSAPYIIKEPIYIPSPAPAYPWGVPVWNQPQITYQTGDSTTPPATVVFCVTGNSSNAQ